jgi:NTE family protein
VIIGANELASIQKADILIPAHTQEYNMTDYQYADKLIQVGYVGAQERAALLEKLALNDADWAQYVALRNGRKREVPVPQFIEVKGTAPVIAEGIQKTLADHVGKPVDFKRLDGDLTDVTGLGRFSRAGSHPCR